MNLDELRKLSPEQAMQAAAKDLSLPGDFFDRMWSKESDRGQNMRSPAGAEGHFQQMPATRSALEQRAGKPLDPNDFHEGLYMASEVMRENLAKFKDPVDATRAYNSGWKPDRWNNPETVGYVQALWGDKASPSTAALPSLKDDRPPKPKATAADAVGMAALRGLSFPDDDTVDAGRTSAQQAQRDAEKVQARKDGVHFGTVVSDALRDPRVMPTWTVMQRFANDEPADPSYDYMARRDKIEADLDEDERLFLRENARSEASETRALAELNYRRGLNQTYSDAGGFASFAGQMVAGFADPASLVAGVVAGKLFQTGRIASAGGRVVGMMAENAAANVAIEGLSDAMGEVKTSGDYASAAAMGAVFTLPFARGVYRQAAEAEARALARGVQERAATEQVGAISKVMQDEPHLTPEQVARRVEDIETNTIRRATEDATGPQRLDRVVPEDVGREMEHEFTGVAPEADATPTPKLAADERLDTPESVQEDVLTQIREKQVVDRGGIDSATGQEVRLSWSATGNKLKGHGNISEALDAVAVHPNAAPDHKALAKYLKKVMAQDSLDIEVRVDARDVASNFDPMGPGIAIHRKDANAAGVALADKVSSLSRYGLEVILHETMHAATYHRINAWEKAGGKLTRDQQKLMAQFEDLYERFKAVVGEKHPRTAESELKNSSGARYAASEMHEFAAQFFTDAETRFVLDSMPAKSLSGRTTSALREMLSLVKRILGFGRLSAFDEGARLLDQIIAMPMSNVTFRNGKPVFAPPTAVPNGFAPMATQRARDTWAERMVQHATDYVRKNPIDMKRLNVLTQKVGGVSDGLVLAGSKNPIMQLVASLVTETTTGAAGRKANVAIRSHMLTRKFVGNTMIDYDSAYTVWRSRNGGGVVEDMFKGDIRRKFDQTVYEEVLRRRVADYAPSPDRAVVEAADALEGLFDRSRMAQVDGGVLGHASLPTSSRGYIPQSLDGARLQAASVQDMALLHNALAEQFQARLGWDAQFARDFAPFYTERVRRRAMGDKGLDALGSGGEGLQVVRDTLEEMKADPTLVDRARAADSKMGQSHTKKRLDLDLLQELRPGLRMLDFYNTNPLLMARSYAKRTAGTVALTEAGIHGIRGVRELEQASLWKGMPVDQQPNAAELEAYRRVMAEILGTPVATATVSSGASNLALLVGLQRLGGLVFTQAAETFNMIGHLGFRSMLAGIADMPRMMGEVGRLKRGAPSGNHILTSIEQYGGEIGTETFKMIAPLDAPDHALGAYVDQPGVMTRLLRAGGHLQSKISGFRGLLAAQHRMVAEQIVMRAARFIRDGADDLALRDMGFTPEVAAALKADLPHIAKWDANDKMVEFDLTRVSDARTAEAFVQAVHRGASQIIQGTFVGERSKWFHNDYARLLLQLRTFGLTATEKQWGRTRMNHGYAYAAGMLLGHMALTVPIHLARVQLASVGREDRDDYIKSSLKPASMVRSLLNYSSLSGMTADVSDILVGVAGGWGGSQVREALGVRNGINTTSVGRVVPIAGTLDTAGRVLSGRTDKTTAIKQLPFSNLWYLVPAINLTKD